MVKDAEGEKVTTEPHLQALGGDGIQSTERGMNLGKQREMDVVPISVL